MATRDEAATKEASWDGAGRGGVYYLRENDNIRGPRCPTRVRKVKMVLVCDAEGHGAPDDDSESLLRMVAADVTASARLQLTWCIVITIPIPRSP